jgi:hypothetical protein
MKETPEQIAKFAAEMAALSKRPEMRPFLTSTEAARQAKDNERKAKEEAERREKEMVELARRDGITAKWFNLHMRELAPKAWGAFQKAGKAAKNPDEASAAVLALNKLGWDISAEMTTATKPGHLPTPVTLCRIKRWNKIKKVERLVWEEPRPIPSKIIKPGDK